MGELRMEDGVMERFKNKLVSSGLKWAGHVERMRGEKLANWHKDQMPRKWKTKIAMGRLR